MTEPQIIELRELRDWQVVLHREKILAKKAPKKHDKLILDEIEQELIHRGLAQERTTDAWGRSAITEFITTGRYNKIAEILKED